MKVVTDTNVLMAGLLKDSIVREILNSNNIEFFIPEQAIEEIKKYKSELCEKSGYTDEEFDTLFSSLLENIKLVPRNEIKPNIEKAEEIMENIDIKDSSFIATAFTINADGIWSFDKHFKRQNEVRIIEIKELIDIF